MLILCHEHEFQTNCFPITDAKRGSRHCIHLEKKYEGASQLGGERIPPAIRDFQKFTASAIHKGIPNVAAIIPKIIEGCFLEELENTLLIVYLKAELRNHI